MRRILLTIAGLCALIGTTDLQAQQFASFYGTVVDVYDGDTITVRLTQQSQNALQRFLSPTELRSGLVRIQLQGIDTPQRRSNDPYWTNSRNYLIQLLRNQSVNVQVIVGALGQLNRNYDLMVGVVRAGRNGRAVNLQMIDAGWAKDDAYNSFGTPYIRAQWQAMNRRRGIWGDREQYYAENEFRKRLYGTESEYGRIKTMPYPSEGSTSGEATVYKSKSPFRPGVGKVDWQKGR